MKEKLKSLKWLVPGILLGIFVMLFFKFPGCNRNQITHVPYPVYKTKIVYKDKYVGIPEPYPVQVPPKVITQYMSYEDSMKLIQANDSLITLIGKIKPDTIRIKTKFLTAFPTSPKLVNILLSHDSLSLTLLDIEANLKTEYYPLFLHDFTYNYGLEGLSAKQRKKPITLPKWRFGIYGLVGYEFLHKRANISTYAQLSYKRWLLQGLFASTIEAQPEFFLNTSIGFKIAEWPRK